MIVNDFIHSNHLSTFTVLLVAAFTMKEEKKTEAASTANAQPCTKYCSVRMRIYFIF